MKFLRIGDSLKAGWGHTRAHFWLLLLLFAVSWGLGLALQHGPWGRIVGTVLSIIVNVLLGMVLLLVYLRIVRGETVTLSSLGDLALGPGKVGAYALGTVATILLVGVGMVLLVVPGIYLLIRFQFVPLLILDEGLGVGAAFEASSHLTQGVKGDYLLFGLACVGVMLLGLLALCVGIIPAAMTVGLAQVWLFEDLKRQAGDAPQAPSHAPVPAVE